MRSTGWILLLCLFMLAAPASGTKLAVGNFASGYYLETDTKGAIYTIELPQAVYRTVTRKDLGDIRVFNGAGDVVPYTIRMVREKENDTEGWQTVPIFPLYHDQAAEMDDLSMRVRRSNDGAILEVRSQHGDRQTRKRLNGYLLDASTLKKPLAELECVWSLHDDGGMVAVAIDGSSDLLHWQNRLDRATLAELHFKGEAIKQNMIALPTGVSDKYLRLRWLDGSKKLELTGLNAKAENRPLSHQLEWLAATGTLATGENGQPELHFALEHLLPFSGIRVWFPDNNSFGVMTLYSRQDDKEQWQKRCQKSFYQLRVDEIELVDNTCIFAPVNQAYWRLVSTNDGAEIGEGSLSVNVQFGYRPHELAFVARGNPPYLLAYGSGLLKEADAQPVPDIISGIEKNGSGGKLIKPARLGKNIVLGGKQALVVPKPPVPWETWLLWSILVAGMLLMVFMARSLMRDMRGKIK